MCSAGYFQVYLPVSDTSVTSLAFPKPYRHFCTSFDGSEPLRKTPASSVHLAKQHPGTFVNICDIPNLYMNYVELPTPLPRIYRLLRLKKPYRHRCGFCSTSKPVQKLLLVPEHHQYPTKPSVNSQYTAYIAGICKYTGALTKVPKV